MKKSIFLLLAIVFSSSVFSNSGYKFRILLKDKGVTEFLIGDPIKFLSQRAIDRRIKQGISITDSDLPISKDYIKRIEDLGCIVVAQSKWVKTLSIHCEDSTIVSGIRDLDFVKRANCVWIGGTASSVRKSDLIAKPATATTSGYYGYGKNQMDLMNGQFLHDEGYKGEGMEIAVIDGGFVGLDTSTLLDNITILGTKDFVYEKGGVVSHGFNVLSLIAANKPNQYVGTAPEAKYWLLRSEDERSETPIEEDYWIAAAEYADSLGVDIITSSLGYSIFNFPFEDHTWNDLDGKTILMSQAAEMATQKGVFVVNSVGNDRDGIFKRIAIPSDAEHVLAVGSVDLNSMPSFFSSIGPAADGRVKPDVVGLGEDVYFMNNDGSTWTSQGTSYSTPIICGMVACLWQAYPDLSNYELLDFIRKSGHKYLSPDVYYGYGIPDMKKAFQLIEDPTSGIEDDAEEIASFKIIPISKGHVRIENKKDTNIYSVLIMTIDGKILLYDRLLQPEQEFALPETPNNVYIVNIRGNGVNVSYKIRF